MKIIGITGGIGSGKTLVLKKLKNLKFTIYNSDIKAKNLMNYNKKIIDSINSFFGPKSYLNNKINTKFLSKQIFLNEEKLKILNEIIHPELEKDFSLFKLYHKNKSLIFKESAIIYEKKNNNKYDAILLVTSHDQNRIKRIIYRNKLSKKEIFQRMNNQWTEKEKINLTDFVIYNNSSIKKLNHQILYFLKYITK